MGESCVISAQCLANNYVHPYVLDAPSPPSTKANNIPQHQTTSFMTQVATGRPCIFLSKPPAHGRHPQSPSQLQLQWPSFVRHQQHNYFLELTTTTTHLPLEKSI